MRNAVRTIQAAAALCLLAGAVRSEELKEIRIGHFPNITHAQALLARATGKFEKELGVPVTWSTFNAGPSAVEAMFADAIDVTYIGPNPAINGYIKSDGEAFQIVAGSASGGAALVIRPDAGIAGDKDFDGKTVATPQLGNTQDVAARAWFGRKGYTLKEKGGTLTILPLANPDQLLMLQKKEIDAAWTVEPWVSRLELEAGGKVYLEEKDLWPEGRYVTTHIIVSRKFLRAHPDAVARLLKAHVELTQEINRDKAAIAPVLNAEIKKETSKEIPEAVIERALSRVEFTWDPVASSLFRSAADAHEAGFIKDEPRLDGIYELSALNQVLAELSLPAVPAP